MDAQTDLVPTMDAQCQGLEIVLLHDNLMICLKPNPLFDLF